MRPEEDSYIDRGDGIFVPRDTGIVHDEENYPEAGFDILARMQQNHFWYVGRHRFLLTALRKVAARQQENREPISVIDLGAGCGGWVRFLHDNEGQHLTEIAAADSSLKALEYSRDHLNQRFSLYQADLLNLRWENRWDAVFLLDVIEHLPDDAAVMRQVHRALKPGGMVFVTVPALPFFWSYHDDIAGHKRRYAKQDFRTLAAASGFEPVLMRYFMFILSPIYFLSRLQGKSFAKMGEEEKRGHIEKAYETPAPLVNRTLRTIFGLESHLGISLPFPWGTSLLGVFRKK